MEDLTLVMKMRDEAKAVLKSFTNEMVQTGAVSKQMADKLNLTNKAMRDAEGISKRLTGTMGQAGGVFRRTAADMNDLHGAGIRVSAGLVGVIRAYGPLFGLAGGALALAAGFRTSTSASLAFSDSLHKMESLVGVSHSQIEEMKGSMLDMSVEFGRAPKEIADAMYFITSSGFAGAEAMGVLKASAMAAAAGMGDMKTIADAATSASNAFGHENLRAADAIGVMLNAVKVGKMEPQALAASMGQVTGVAAQMGTSFHDVAGAAAALSLTGLPAAEALTTIRQTLLAVNAPGEEARKMLTKLGSSQEQVAKVFRDKGYLAGIQFLVDLTSKAGSAQGSALRKVLQDVQAVNGALTLTGKNAQEIKRVFAEVGAAGEKDLKKAFSIASQSPNFSMNQGMALMQRLAISIGDSAMPTLVRGVNAAVQAFGFLSERSTDVKAALAGAATSLLAFYTLLGRGPIVAAARAVAALAGSFIVVNGAILTAAGSIITWQAALAATGIGAAVVGLGAIVAYLVKNSEAAQNAKIATDAKSEADRQLAEITSIAANATNDLATASEKERVAALRAAQADRVRIASLIDKAKAAKAAAIAQLQEANAALAKFDAINKVAANDPRIMGGPLANDRAAARRRAAEASSDVAQQRRVIAEGMTSLGGLDKVIAAAQNPTKVEGLGETIDPFAKEGKSGGSKAKGGKSEATRNWEDQRKAINEWLIAAQKAEAEIEKLNQIIVTPSEVFFGGTPDEMERFRAEQDALFDKRQQAQERAIQKGHELNAQQMQAIQLTAEESSAIGRKVEAEIRLRAAQNSEKSLNEMRDQLAVAKEQVQVYEDQTIPFRYLTALAEARAKAAAEHRDITQSEIEAATRLVDAGMRVEEAKNSRSTVFDNELAQQDIAQRMAVGFNAMSREQQVSLRLWEETIAKRRALGDLTAELGPAEVAAIRATADAQYDLNEAQEQFNRNREMSMGFFDAFSSFFRDSITGAKSFKDAIAGLLQSLADLVLQYMVLIPLKRAFESSLGSGGLPFGMGGGLMPMGGSGGGWLGSIIGGIAGAFGGGATAGAIGIGNFGGIGGWADGGGGVIKGRAGVDKNLLAINGVGVARVSRDEVLEVRPKDSGGGVFAPQVTVVVQSNGEENPHELGRKIGDAVDQRMAKFAERQMKPGGMFWHGGKR